MPLELMGKRVEGRRKCAICKKIKSLSLFYINRSKAIGHSYRCKDCERIIYRDRRLKHIEVFKRRERDHYKRHKDEIARKGKRRYQKAKYKYSARGKVRRAIYKGILNKPKWCSICLKVTNQLDAHHDDYKKPLVVRWLCKCCHMRHHHGK
mgnify:CR=1 FL=1